jgi:uncharacterized protein YbjT (DUF2867 family)
LRLLAAGHVVTGLGRSVATARHRYPEAIWLEHDIALLTNPENWYHLIEDIDGVVNCAGALQDSARDDVRAVQSIAMRALFAACVHKGVRRFVQISAVGASADAKTAFMRTKGEADDVLAKQDLDWVILRPGLVIAPYAYGATALIRALASIPLLVPLADGDAVIQSVHVDDVADAVSLAVAGQVPKGIYDLVEEKPHTLRELVRSWRAWLGYAPAPIIPVPSALADAAFGMGDVLGWLGWRSPLRSTALRQIKAGVTGDAAAWRAATGRTPSSLSETLRRIPASVQERWFARLWLLKPVAIAVLALFWLLSGLLALSNMDVAASRLTARGLGLQEGNSCSSLRCGS